MPDDLPPDFWNAETEYIAAALFLLLQDAAFDGVTIGREQIEAAGLGIDPADPQAQAAAWARRYTDELLAQFGTTNRRVVGEIVANWIATPGATLDNLRDSIHQALGGAKWRAELIGRTEVTRAFAEGADLARQAAGLPRTAFKPPLHPDCRCSDAPQLLDTGEWVVIWVTAYDELVCQSPVPTPWGEVRGCRDMQGRIISEGPLFGKFV
jgi:hypothetical protein